jgi:hypothetical protein
LEDVKKKERRGTAMKGKKVNKNISVTCQMTARLSHTHTPTSISIESLAITDMFSNFFLSSPTQHRTTSFGSAYMAGSERFLHNIIFILHFYYTLYSLFPIKLLRCRCRRRRLLYLQPPHTLTRIFDIFPC